MTLTMRLIAPNDYAVFDDGSGDRVASARGDLFAGAFLPFKHFHLNLISQERQMVGEPVKGRLLGLIGRKVTNEGALCRFLAQPLNLSLVVFHSGSQCAVLCRFFPE
jgi:hypothetical protein